MTNEKHSKVETGKKPGSVPAGLSEKRWRTWVTVGVAVALVGIACAVGGTVAGYVLARRGAASSTGAAASDSAATVWTCSMHPQIKLPKPGKCPICFMDLIPLEDDAGEDDSPRQLKMSKRAAALAEIQTVPVKRQYAERIVRMVGLVDYDETKVANISAWVDGRLDRLYVDYTGVTVRKGDHLVYLYSPNLIVAQRELLQTWKAHNRPDALDRDLTARTLKSTEEKLRLLGLLDEQIEEIKRRGTTTDHLTIYAPIGGIVIDKHANEGMYVKTGMKIYTIADLSRVWVHLDAYESDIPWVRYGQQVEFTTEAYPGEVFKGRIAFVNPVLDRQTRTVKVRVNVPNPDQKLKPGMFVRARVRSQLAAGGRVFDASLVGKWISPMHPEIVKDGPGKCDICGMDLVPAEELGYIVPKKAPEVPLVIPATAPLITGKRAVVYVRLPDRQQPTFEGREIMLGYRAGDYYIVRHGLNEGELVVTKGNFKIDSALQIKARPSMMSPEGGATATGHDHGGGDMAARAGHEHAKPETAKVTVPSAFRVLLNRAYQSYLAAADALADDDLGAAREALGKIPKAVKAVDATSLDAEARSQWKESADRIIFAAYETLDARKRDDVRRHFGELSGEFVALVKAFGHALQDPVHQHHCPMALDAKGADWLQRDGDTRNPYFGPAMLGCGDRVATYESQAPLKVPSQFREQLAGLYDAYLSVQEALADDRLADAKAAWQQVREALPVPDAQLLDGRTREAWQADHARLERALKDSVTDADLEGLRKRFEPLSETMLAIADSFGHTRDGPLHKAFCPMAFDNKGAAWLQAGEKIANPYFGHKMLRCGEIQRVFVAATGGAEAGVQVEEDRR